MIPQPSHDPISEHDRMMARESRIKLSKLPVSTSDIRLQIDNGKKAIESIELPSSALHLIARILDEIADGHQVSIVQHRAEMSTQAAADYLSVSRPYVVGLIESGEIPCRKVGNRRRVLFADVDAYRRREDAARLDALAELSAQAQDLSMGY